MISLLWGPLRVWIYTLNLINNLEFLQDGDYHPESLLRNYLDKQNVKVERFDFCVRIQ